MELECLIEFYIFSYLFPGLCRIEVNICHHLSLSWMDTSPSISISETSLLIIVLEESVVLICERAYMEWECLMEFYIFNIYRGEYISPPISMFPHFNCSLFVEVWGRSVWATTLETHFPHILLSEIIRDGQEGREWEGRGKKIVLRTTLPTRTIMVPGDCIMGKRSQVTVYYTNRKAKAGLQETKVG